MVDVKDKLLSILISDSIERRKCWKQFRFRWISEVEGGINKSGLNAVQSAFYTRQPNFIIIGRHAEITDALRLILHNCIIRCEILICELENLPTKISYSNHPDLFRLVNDGSPPVSNRQSNFNPCFIFPVGVEIFGLEGKSSLRLSCSRVFLLYSIYSSGSGKMHFCKSIALAAPWLRIMESKFQQRFSDSDAEARNHTVADDDDDSIDKSLAEPPLTVTIDLLEYLHNNDACLSDISDHFISSTFQYRRSPSGICQYYHIYHEIIR